MPGRTCRGLRFILNCHMHLVTTLGTPACVFIGTNLLVTSDARTKFPEPVHCLVSSWYDTAIGICHFGGSTINPLNFRGGIYCLAIDASTGVPRASGWKQMNISGISPSDRAGCGALQIQIEKLAPIVLRVY